jgi:hypothetical protein
MLVACYAATRITRPAQLQWAAETRVLTEGQHKHYVFASFGRPCNWAVEGK